MIIAVFVLVILNILATACVALLLIRRTSGSEGTQVQDAVRAGNAELRQELGTQRTELRQGMGEVRTELDAKLTAMAEANANRHLQVQVLLQQEMEKLRAGNEAKLEKMRETVDEKLQGTLEKRLGDSFELVSKRLEMVQKGLGEMQSLAQDVGGLKRVLTNVKSRGSWGEVQLARQLEDILTAEQ